MNREQITALIIIFIYMGVTIAIGLFVSRKKSDKKESNDDFLMASKSLGPVVLAGTLFAANTGGASTTGIATNVYKYGLSASWYVIAAGISFVLVSFIAPYFRRAKANTVPQIISKRYGKASHIFTAITSITALFMATGAQIIATASIINVVTGFNFKTAAIVSTIVVIIYTVFGGFDSLFEKAKLLKETNGTNLDLLSMTKVGATTIIGYIAMYFMTFPTGQEIVQTYCSAKDGKSAKLGSIIAGVVSALYAIVPTIIGLLAYVCIDGYALGGAQKNALAQATITFAPPILAGVVLAAIVAATMSSASGNMIGTATMFTNDIFVPYINKGVKDDKKEIWISKIAMLIVGSVGLYIALEASDVISVMMGAFALRSAGPFAAFICGIFCKNITKRAGFLSIVMGTLTAAVWIYGFDTPWGLNAMIPGGVIAFIVIFVVSKIDIKMGILPAPEIEFDDI